MKGGREGEENNIRGKGEENDMRAPKALILK